MNARNLAAAISTILAIYACIPYAQSIIKGKTKPHRLSWLVFCIMNGIVFTSQFLEGARASVIISGIFFIGSFVNFLLSLKYGVHDSSRWDKTLFALALATITIWFITRSNATAIWLTLLIDVLATSMIVLKIRVQPYSEAPIPWLIATVAFVFTCLTLAGKPLSVLYVRPIYGLLSDVLVVAAIYLFRKKSKSKATIAPPAL